MSDANRTSVFVSFAFLLAAVNSVTRRARARRDTGVSRTRVFAPCLGFLRL